MTEEKNIDHISFSGMFWTQIRPYLISFGSVGLPKNIHYTFAFNENSDSINLHLTKDKTEYSEKLQVRLLEIKKEHVEELTNYIGKRMLDAILKPFDLASFKRSGRGRIGFLSHDDLQKREIASVIEAKLIETFEPITEIKGKTRVKVKGDVNIVGEKLEGFATSRDMFQLLRKNIKPVKHKTNGMLVVGGMMISRKETRHVIRIANNWFEIQLPENINAFLIAISNEKIAAGFIRRAQRGIMKLRKATGQKGLKELDPPIKLVLIKKN